MLLKTFCLILSVVMAGCSVDLDFDQDTEAAMEAGAYHIIIKPGGASTHGYSRSEEDSDYHILVSDDTAVEIIDGILLVNNVHYGELDTGNVIVVDDGAVFVEDKERSGDPLTDDEIMDIAPVKETVRKWNGMEITLRPGSHFVAEQKDILRVGKTEIVIDDGELFVEGDSYGNVEEGDKIRAEPSEVFVSGEKR